MPQVLHSPWREVKLPADRPLRWGVLWDDGMCCPIPELGRKAKQDLGVVAPSPACLRVLTMVTEVLQKNGHEIMTL